MSKIDRLKQALDAFNAEEVQTPLEHCKYGMALYDYAECYMEKEFRECVNKFDKTQPISL